MIYDLTIKDMALILELLDTLKKYEVAAKFDLTVCQLSRKINTAKKGGYSVFKWYDDGVLNKHCTEYDYYLKCEIERAEVPVFLF